MANEVITKAAVTQSDFETFKKDIESQFKHLTNSMVLKLSGVIVGSVTISFFALAWLFDFRQDFIKEQNQARFERIESNIFIPAYGIKNREGQSASANQDRSLNIPTYKKKPFSKTQKTKK